MWFLRTEGEPAPGAEAAAFFLSEGTSEVGRQTGKGYAIVIANDPSISRRHAAITIGQLDRALDSRSSFKLTDFSRFGTGVNGTPVGSGNTVDVKHGDVIQFGHKTKFRVTWDQVVLCMPEATVPDAHVWAAKLGFHSRKDWDALCTHLVLSGLKPTSSHSLFAAVACAKAAGKPVVHTDWLRACTEAGQAAEKGMPPPCTSFLLPLVRPETAAVALLPDTASVAPSVEHTPLRGWTVAWPATMQKHETAVQHLQMASELAGAANATAGDPALASLPRDRLLHIAPAPGEPPRAGQLSMTCEDLMAVIIDGRSAALQALLQQAGEPQHQQPTAGRALTQRHLPAQVKKRPAAAPVGGRAEKKHRKGRASVRSSDDTSGDMAFDVVDQGPPPRGDTAAAPAPMETDQTVVFEPLVKVVQSPPRSAGGNTAAEPNFKSFRKRHTDSAQQPIIGFAAASYAQEVKSAKDFLRAERQAGLQNKAADDLFAAAVKAKKPGRKK